MVDENIAVLSAIEGHYVKVSREITDEAVLTV